LSDKEKPKRELAFHRLTVLILYIFAFSAAFSVVGLAYIDPNSSVVLIISSGAILATFGSAISAIGSVWEKDLLERITTNVDILFVDILKQQKWRRWPFLPRSASHKQLDGTHLEQNLSKPTLPLNVGTDHIEVDIPTVLEDFFDLPVLKNTVKLLKFRIAASTTLLKGKEVHVETATGLSCSDEYMAYECIYSTWMSVFQFRLFRYVAQFGSALTIWGAFVTVGFVVASKC
jgi:hypothetical protein